MFLPSYLELYGAVGRSLGRAESESESCQAVNAKVKLSNAGNINRFSRHVTGSKHRIHFLRGTNSKHTDVVESIST